MSIAWENNTAATSETQRFSIDSTINDKIRRAAAGLQSGIQDLFLVFPTERDKELVADFITACVQHENIAVGTKRAYLVALARLSSRVRKPLEDITAKDLTAYINSIQPENAQNEDPDQSWINTQRAFGSPLLKFFKWLAYPEMTPQERKYLPRDKYPAVLKGVVLQTKKGSKSPIKAKDIWNDQDVAIFLKYCRDNTRLRFYHALAYETSARPGELLQLKIGDIKIESEEVQKEDGTITIQLYSALDIGRYGKKRKSRIVGITDFTIQYYQEYLSKTHPDPTNKEAFLFISRERSAYSRNVPISVEALRMDYIFFRDNTIPKLLKRPEIPQEDKEHLQFLKEQKKWNPYTMRHSSITKLARDPNINDYTLRQHCGWTKRSDMVEVYTHELKGDSFEHVMLAYGINLKDRNKKKKQNEKLQQELIGSHCPFCKMVNIAGTQFCSSCHRPLLPTSIDTIIKGSEQAKQQLQQLQDKVDFMDSRFRKFMDVLIQDLPQSVNPDNTPFIYTNDRSTGMARLDHRQIILKALQMSNAQGEEGEAKEE